MMVYQDEQYILGQEDGQVYLVTDSKKYMLTCNPYEPCLYIIDENGFQTVVHNAFDPQVVLECFHEGKPVSSITGFYYKPEDFCRMVEFASQMGNITIDEAEKVFAKHPKDDNTENKTAVKKTPLIRHEPLPTGRDHIVHDRQFENLISHYPDCIIDYVICEAGDSETRLNAHRHALDWACGELFYDGNELIWGYDTSNAKCNPISTSELFGREKPDSGINYRKAFLCPPYENGYDDDDFELVNSILFPNGTDELEAFEWDTGWSEYFDEGNERWGSLCFTVYDRKTNRFIVIMASATD